MTQVTRMVALGLLLWAFLLTGGARMQGQSPPAVLPAPQVQGAEISRDKPAESLYRQLGRVGLDPARTYKVRGASLDRPALHITLEDGEISFTTEIHGRITGAFFEGEGEVLLTPPNRVERASMGLFTGMAILEEHFLTAYFRFNDDTFAEVQPFLRPADNASEFAARWNETARNLAEFDALRLMVDFSRFLPSPQTAEPSPSQTSPPFPDRMLHALVQGEKLGTFDLSFDQAASEEVWAGQTRHADAVTYYDLWTSFALGNIGVRTPRKEPDHTVKLDQVAISGYKISADVRPPTELNADTRLQVKVRQGGQRTLLFELSRFLQVKEVDVNGAAVEFIHNPPLDGTQVARRGNDLVAVIFPEPLRAGQTLELRFLYGGEVLSEAGSGLLYVGARGTWYPNRGIEMADFDLEFHYPPSWTLVATGKRVPADSSVEPSHTASSEAVSRWVTERPAGLAGFNLGKYEHEVATASGVRVDTFAAQGVERAFPRPPAVVTVPDVRHHGVIAATPLAPDPSPARNARAVAEAAARTVDFFSLRFGPYPYGSLQLTQMPGRLSQGWPGLVFLSSYAFLTPTEQGDLHMDHVETNLSRLILPHEIAHQWWGDLVGWRSYRDQWVVEGLANYCALMTIEAQNPAVFHKLLDKYRVDLLHENKDGVPLRDAGPVTLGQRLSSSHFPNGYEGISYGRGTWLFHMLREMLLDAEAMNPAKQARARGNVDEPFVRALRRVRERYAGKEITTAELFAAFEPELPPALQYEGRKSLDWFVEGWVGGVALPQLVLQNVKFTAKNGAMLVTGVILQKEAPDDLVSSVPLYAVQGGKPILLARVFADGPETTFHVVAPAGTKKILLDPNQTLLSSPKTHN